MEGKSKFHLYKGTDSVPFQLERETLCYCTLNRDRRIQYFSLHSPALKKGSRQGLIPNLTFESNFSYCWYKPSDHMLLQMPTCPVWMRLCAEQKESSPTFNRSRILCGTDRNNMHDCSPQIMHLMSSAFCLPLGQRLLFLNKSALILDS